MTELLADMRANIEVGDKNGCTALVGAVMAKNEVLVDFLLSFSIDRNPRLRGWPALYAAMVNGDDDMARIL